MTSGVALFGTLTSFLANISLSPKKKEVNEDKTGTPAADLAEIKQLLE